MTDVNIRPYAARDRTALLRMIADLQDHEVPLHDSRLPGAETSEPYLSSMEERLREQSGAMYIAEAAGAPVGYVACFVEEYDSAQETPDSSRCGLVKDIFLDPAFRGSGLAQRLLAVAETHLRTTGVTRLRINVLANNAKARRAYERYGFAPYEVMYKKRIAPSASQLIEPQR